ncbi:transposase [Maioricimonas rarisocia]|nr:transposase [Maioricimonas rarisocia]
MGRRPDERQQELWIATSRAASAPQHIFYDKLNQLLDEAGFDAFVEELCEPFYKQAGRRSIPPGRSFRMLLIGYFKGSDSQRGIAWPCSDSLSLRKFLFISTGEDDDPTDTDSRILKMKDGRTHLAYKAEHTVDPDSGAPHAAVLLKRTFQSGNVPGMPVAHARGRPRVVVRINVSAEAPCGCQVRLPGSNADPLHGGCR